MVDRDAPTTAGPVVICCAGPDGDTIRPVVEDLEAQGHTVTLLEGIESSPAALGPAVELLNGEGLYVLCRSKALGRSAVDELRDILLAHHVPFGRTLTVASTRPKELRERIGASLRRLATGQARRTSSAAPDARTSRTTRQGIKPPAAKPVAAAPPAVAPQRSRATRVGLPPPDPAKAPPAAAPAPSPPRKAAAPPPLPPKPPVAPRVVAKAPADPQPDPPPPEEPIDDPFEAEAPANLVPAVEEEREVEEDPEEAAPEPSAEALIRPDDLADLDVAEDLDAALPADDQEARDRGPGAPPPVRTGTTTVSPVIPPSTLDAIRTGDTAIVSREALLAAGLAEQEHDEEKADNAPSFPAPLDNGAAPPSLPGGTVRAAATRLPDDDTDGGEAKKPPWLWIGIGAAAIALVGIIAVAVSGGGDDDDDDTTVAKAETSEASSDSASAKETSTPSPSEDPDSPATADEHVASPGKGPTRIGHALRTRAVRGLDVLLISDTQGPLSWEAAKEHCGGLELGGLSTWRLPAVGELMSLTQAQMTQRGYYWSATPADTFGDTPLVWYAKRSRVVTRGRDNLVLCVRGGSGAG